MPHTPVNEISVDEIAISLSPEFKSVHRSKKINTTIRSSITVKNQHVKPTFGYGGENVKKIITNIEN
jgi:dihydroorotate dehydrogenase